MTAYDFPSSPSDGQIETTPEGITRKYNLAENKWYIIATTITGPSGSAGQTSYAGVRYTFSTTTTDADPGSGFIRFNNALTSGITFIYIDNNDFTGVSKTSWYDTWDDAESTVKGVLTLTTGTGDVSVFHIINAVTVASGYYKIPVQYINGAVPGSGNSIYVSFSRTGDDGDPIPLILALS